MMLRAHQTVCECKNEEERSKAQVWSTELSRRLYKLYCFRDLAAQNRQSEAQERDDEEIQEQSVCDGQSNSSRPLACGNSSLQQVVPGYPKNVAEVILMWRYGSDKTKNIALRHLQSAHGRKEKIPGYTNSKWWRSGQKSSFQRLMRIVKGVAKAIQPPISSISEEGADEKWAQALQNFLSKYGNTRLSSLEKLLRQEARSKQGCTAIEE